MTSDPLEKQCSKCKIVKPWGEFWPVRMGGKEYRSHCKDCHLSYGRTPQAKARHSAYSKEYSKRPAVRARINAKARERNKTLRGRYQHIKSGAKVRNLPFELSLEQFSTFWQKPCFYCGTVVETIGLDRINPAKGYNMVNVLSACAWCNWMKHDRGALEFVAHLERIVAHLNGYGARIPEYKSLPVGVKDYLWDYFDWEGRDHVRKVL